MYNHKMTAALIGAAATIALVQPQVAVALSSEQIAKLAKEFTVRIEGEKQGSGVIIERDDNTYRVLTNWHVVNREGQYQIVTIDGKKHRVIYRQVRYLPGIDIAVLEFYSSESYRTAKLGDSEDLTEGKEIHVVGWADPIPTIPDRHYQFLKANIVSLLENPEKGYAIVHDNAASSGTSGGPFLDSRGRLVGVNGRSRFDPNNGKVLGLGIPMQIFLAGRNGLQPPPGITLPDMALSSEQIAKLAKEFTVRIEGETQGSGVIIERDDNTYRVLTNWHVVKREGQYQIVTPDGQKHGVTYSKVRYLPGVDIAVLEFTSGERYRTAPLGNSQEMTEGKVVHLVGWADPIPGLLERSYQFIVAKIVSRVQNPEKGYAIVYDNSTTPGTSGGPMLDANGRLVGINGIVTFERSTGRVFGLGIPMQKVLDLLGF